MADAKAQDISTAHAIGGKRQPLSAQEERERKQRVLTKGTPSIVTSIADAVVIKAGDLFFLAKPDGSVPLGGEHGFGLYYHDCRYLNSYTMTVAGTTPTVLVSSGAHGFSAIFQLTNPDIRMENNQLISKDQISIRWTRTVDSEKLTLRDVIQFQNLGLEPVEFPVTLTFQSAFEDIFAVRGLLSERPGTLHPPEWEDGRLCFLYDGADGLYRCLSVEMSPTPDSTIGTSAEFNLTLDPRDQQDVQISLCLAESPNEGEVRRHEDQGDMQGIESGHKRRGEDWLRKQISVWSNSLLLNRIIDRSMRDLEMLRSTIDGEEYFAAGLPWFGTLFGRDSIITALQTLAYDPTIAEQTLRVLAHRQGQRVDDWRDEQPGKILHELRIGEMARLGEIPHTPYYGTIDATPLFLVLIAQHAGWTGDLSLFHQLRPNVEAALNWMTEFGDLDGDGYIEYASSSEQGLVNQGWKDSGDAIVDVNGKLAQPPIALVEVQGYAYMARIEMARLFRRTGDHKRAEQLEQEAQTLRENFNRDFWMEDQGIYALALQGDKSQATVVSSNPGHALWSGIADPDKAQRTVERLMTDDMFTGWGIRTLSSRELRYNPIGYHLGTVWPHDNAIIAAGLRSYGFDNAASRIITGIASATLHFDHYRLPELFSGFNRENYGVPVRYPVACHPQAWAAGAFPFIVATGLGLIPNAFERQLRIERPALPEFVQQLIIRGLRVGDARTDLAFEQAGRGAVGVNVLKVDGELDVIVEPRTPHS